jgi:hypothetical protein
MDTGAKIFIGASLIFTVFIGVMAHREKQQKQQAIPIEEVFHPDTNSWCYGKERLQLQDEHGQVYALEKTFNTNMNIFRVWRSMGETNGITNSFAHKGRWFMDGNWFLNLENAEVRQVPPFTTGGEQ